MTTLWYITIKDCERNKNLDLQQQMKKIWRDLSNVLEYLDISQNIQGMDQTACVRISFEEKKRRNRDMNISLF